VGRGQRIQERKDLPGLSKGVSGSQAVRRAEELMGKTCKSLSRGGKNEEVHTEYCISLENKKVNMGGEARRGNCWGAKKWVLLQSVWEEGIFKKEEGEKKGDVRHATEDRAWGAIHVNREEVGSRKRRSEKEAAGGGIQREKRLYVTERSLREGGRKRETNKKGVRWKKKVLRGGRREKESGPAKSKF